MTTLVHVSGLHGYRSLVEELGGDPDQLIRNVDLDPGIFVQEDHFIPFSTMSSLLEMTALQLRQPGFGLLLSRRQGTHSLGSLGLLMESAANLQSAFDYLQQYLRLHTQGASIRLTTEGPVAIVRYTLPNRVSGNRQVAELGLGFIVVCLRTLLGSNWAPAGVCFMHSAGVHQKLYRMMFRAPVTFGQAFNGLTISADLLERPIDRHDPDVTPYLQRHAENILRASDTDFLTQVRQAIIRKLSAGGASLEQVSAALGIRPRTLQHRLMHEGTTFLNIIEEVRAGVARKYLAESGSGLSQLAARLGYADQAVFSRAFRRWSGMTPSQWRRENRVRGRNQ